MRNSYIYRSDWGLFCFNGFPLPFKLDNENSPFSKALKWDFAKEILPIPKEGVTTDYFQYMLIIKASDAVTPN